MPNRYYSLGSSQLLNGQKTEKLIVLGAGWAANRFLSSIDKKRYDITVVSPRNHFLFTPLLPSTTVGTLDFRSIIEPMRKSRRAGWLFFQAACTDVDADKKIITCEETCGESHRQFSLQFDKLIVAIGADNNTYDIPGVKEYALFLKELNDARKIRSKIIECFERASIPGVSAEERARLLNFVVVGGGPTGVEFVSELSDFFWEDLHHYFPDVPVNEVRITLLEASHTILSAFHKALVERIMVNIKRQGVDVRTHALVTKVLPDAVYLADGTKIPYGLLVWSTGVGPRPLAKKLNWPKTKQGRFVVDDHLRVQTLQDVYAMGDCAEIEGYPLMATAQVAVQQARYLAKILNTYTMNPNAQIPPFRYKFLGTMVYTGGHKSAMVSFAKI
jgi:NADH:ubiquinone reductase (non-electrogenic)